jgi:hypothetical protein
MRLRSLLLVDERLLEAEYFTKRMRLLRNPSFFAYNLNAFLSAARSVTFLLQKEMSGVPNFTDWWEQQQEVLRKDECARFFHELRNFSQKRGRVSVIGTGSHRINTLYWSYRFAGGEHPVPKDLLHRDVAQCCREHVAKLARITLACADEFPFQTCPAKALTVDGIRSLGLSVDDVEEYLGFPRGWTAGGPDPRNDQRLQVLRGYVDAVDFETVKRLAKIPSKHAGDNSDTLGGSLATSLVDAFEGTRGKKGTTSGHCETR